MQQQLSPVPSTVQVVENTQQNTPTIPPPPKINTEKEELIKMLRDTSTTSTMKKQVPPSLSQVANKPIENDIDVLANEGDGKQLQLVKGVGAVALWAGIINAVTSKKKGTKDDSNPPPSSSSYYEPSSPPLVELKTPKPPSSEPPIRSPSDKRLTEMLGLLEDDLQELNKNLELLENDLYDLNEDLDSLQEDQGGGGGGSNQPWVSDASANTISGGSYLDSLAGSGQFEPKRSGTGLQSYLGGLGGAPPLEFDYDDYTAAMEE